MDWLLLKCSENLLNVVRVFLLHKLIFDSTGTNLLSVTSFSGVVRNKPNNILILSDSMLKTLRMRELTVI